MKKVEQALVLWMKYARSQNVHISNLLFKEKAFQITKELRENELSASNGWVQRFKSRAADVDLVNQW